jgi:HAD superfamily hydrolase (TIGR01509 family)
VRLFKQLRERVRASGVELSAFDGANEVLQEMGYSIDAAELESVVAQLEYSCLADTELVPGTAEALDALRVEGVRLGVVSSAGFPPFVEKALERFDLRRFFDEVLTSAGEGMYKSDPEIFRRAVARMGGTPDEAVHVGDHAMYDVDAAAKAGLSTIWFAREAERTARLHGHDWEALQRTGSRADAVVTDLRDVPAAVARL